ncbi:MAG TPA: hypothetical protein DDZ89_09110, partial [Clostridiales bacterium]|nr:hypothetical protein [Clostridiales bacterium]
MYYQKENDETLVMLTLAGEQSAYEVLVIRYQKAVIASALSVTRNQFMAEDAAQDAFVTAWMKLDTLQDGAKFSPWVCRIAKNCALNMVMRFKSYMPLASVENLNIHDNPALNPAELYVLSEEKEEIYKSTAKLPQKVKEIIHLHYFDGLSIAEIAERMRISEGTVKWQLHDGRKRIRKELCAMNEKYSDTLVQRVMKKVEELKLWQFKNDKSGFEVVYKTVLKDVEDLPESRDKSHALADVLMRGWWWLPGEKNDALFARISEAALEGKNEEAMTFIVAREDSKVWGSAKIDFIRDKQIPRLEKAGFMQALGREWFWLGYHYFREGKAKEGHAAYDKVCEVLKPSDSYYTLIPYARKMEAVLENEYKDESEKRYRIGSNADEFRYFDGTLRFWSNEGFGEGYMHSVDSDIMRIFRNSCLCDGQFFADIKTGESYIGSDGTTLTYASDCETVESPAGVFKDCRVWITKHFNWSGKSIFKSYYKEGVGIVKHEHIQDGLYDVRLLSSYHITGGDGLLPMAYGNRWEYISKYATDIMTAELTFDVSYADKNKVVLTSWKNITRHKYDENLWLDMIQQIRSDYCEEINGSQKLCDVYHAVERAGALAKAPMEQAHTKAASSVVRRILATDPVFNPNHTATGHWNFFSKVFVRKKKDTISITYNRRWSFEWKNTGSMGHAEEPILYNDIYGILQDATNCIWSEEWRIGASPMIEYNPYDMTIQTKITCENGGTITTKAGTFENCLKLSLDIGGMTDGL